MRAFWRSSGILALGGGLAGCAGGGEDATLGDRLIGPPAIDVGAVRNPLGGPEDALALRQPNRIDPTVREAPELFDESGRAIWDGKPTLAGLWVAHPAAGMSLRVRMVNPRTGTTVDGALLPGGTEMRDRDMMLSSEAAGALGLIPNVTAEVRLVAIEETPLSMTPSFAAGGPLPPRSEPAVTVGPAGVAEGGVESAGTPPPAAAPAPAAPSAESFLAALGPAVAGPLAPSAPPVAPAAGVVAARPQATVAPVQPSPTPGGAFVPAVVQAVDAAVPGAESEGAGPVAADAASAVEPAADAAITDGRPYIDAGIYAASAEAADLVRALVRLGIPARNLATETDGAAQSRVVAGPFRTAGARANALRALQSIGVADARPAPG